MPKVTIRSDGNGGAEVIGPIPKGNGFYEFALRKVLSGKFTEISWEPVVGIEAIPPTNLQHERR